MDNIIYSAFLKLTPKDQQDLIFDFMSLFNKQHKLEPGVIKKFNEDLDFKRLSLAVDSLDTKKSKNLLKNLKSKKRIGTAVANALWDSPTFREMLVKEMKAQ
jgi:hypothetical protein